MVDVTRLMWDDFVIVVVALLLHRSLENKFDRIAQWAVRSVADAWNALLIKKIVPSVKEKRDDV